MADQRGGGRNAQDFTVFRSVEDALAVLPEDEQRRYRECQQSVIDARREGERIARETWIG